MLCATFLLIPAEEANVHLGGHWALFSPKPVYWYMSRNPDEAFRTTDPKYGTVDRKGPGARFRQVIWLLRPGSYPAVYPSQRSRPAKTMANCSRLRPPSLRIALTLGYVGT